MSSTERGYDLIAPKFDYTPFRTPRDLLAGVAPQIGPHGSVERGLDVCCGTGAGMEMLRPLCTGEVVGVDMSAGMLEEAERRSASWEGTAACRFVRTMVEEMPFRDHFDVAVSFGAFGHILPEEQPAFFAAIHRALKPGGRFVCVSAEHPSVFSRAWILSKGFNAAMVVRNALFKPEFIMYYLLFMLPEAKELLQTVGFDVELRSDVLPAPYQRYVVVVATKRETGG